ncbi:glutaredoxin family protein [Actimicrobium sp. CCI2.3]|uniref:glutaredoxin family protein n=1 Tax=Actimicrobium sp. CCI2.3 TaxID=3048616 RepID=UPI002AB4340B|nr:glutaredoxin family protein [Actimicrobium sp. CCI2.3]MDY7575130.1 glutaredoxin family protein [Actimicrobium sp. CCI2.3]MEB0023618.1 glutaredoxin family protein [Actimicrobium sp. CCI2.3]
MLVALRAHLGETQADIRILDVDEDPVLLEKYDERVPVLKGRYDDGADSDLCQFFQDSERLAQFIASRPQA